MFYTNYCSDNGHYNINQILAYHDDLSSFSLDWHWLEVAVTATTRAHHWNTFGFRITIAPERNVDQFSLNSSAGCTDLEGIVLMFWNVERITLSVAKFVFDLFTVTTRMRNFLHKCFTCKENWRLLLFSHMQVNGKISWFDLRRSGVSW